MPEKQEELKFDTPASESRKQPQTHDELVAAVQQELVRIFTEKAEHHENPANLIITDLLPTILAQHQEWGNHDASEFIGELAEWKALARRINSNRFLQKGIETPEDAAAQRPEQTDFLSN